jgi:predicted dehydrogenase
MKENTGPSRRGFIKKLTTATAAVAVGSNLFAAVKEQKPFEYLRRRSAVGANDHINLALIGAGGQGSGDTDVALTVPGIKLVAVCDLYDGRLAAAKKRWGADIFTTKSYKEILNRSDVDAVIVGTPDFWHQQISIDAMHAGKHVYCEKPMVHSITEGPAIIKAQQETGKIFQVGSQGMSSLGNEKAKELLKSGAIGQLNYAEGFWARREPEEIWQYAIPDDASTQTVDWDTYVSKAQKRPFDAKRFFRWRNYTDYGTGMAGDLFVHLFSSLHFVTGSLGPEKIYASGGLRFWKDGREVPDVLLGIFDYNQTAALPAFNLSLRCNFVDGTSGSTYLRLVGSEGAMDITWDKVVLKRNKGFTSEDPLYLDKLRKSGDTNPIRRPMMPPEEISFDADKDYKGAHYDHFNNFFTAIRNNGKVTEDATFGYRAAAPALLCNDSYFKNEPMHWNPEKMVVMKG